MRQTLTDQLTQQLFEIAQTQLDADLKKKCQFRLLDYLGCSYAGAVMLESQLHALLQFQGNEQGTVNVIGLNQKAPMQTATLCNAMSAHVAELDDGERFGMVHPGAPVISALIAIAHQKNALSFEGLLKGIYVGYEATLRMAHLVQPMLKDGGYHATGICGSIGAAMGIAAALSFTQDEMKTAFSASVTGASGMLKVIRDGSQLKPYNAAQAALSGLNAALVARLGFHGPQDVLEGKQGFFYMVTGNSEVNGLKSYPKDFIAVEQVYTKPYAACRHCHAPIEAVLTLVKQYDITAEQIQRITVTSHRFACYLHDHKDIENESSAKMSIPYSVAISAFTRKASINEFTQKWIDHPELKVLIEKVDVKVDESLTALVPQKRPARVDIALKSGKKLTLQVDLPKGEPETPLSDEAFIEKFLTLAVFGGKTQEQAESLAALLQRDQIDLPCFLNQI